MNDSFAIKLSYWIVLMDWCFHIIYSWNTLFLLRVVAYRRLNDLARKAVPSFACTVNLKLGPEPNLREWPPIICGAKRRLLELCRDNHFCDLCLSLVPDFDLFRRRLLISLKLKTFHYIHKGDVIISCYCRILSCVYSLSKSHTEILLSQKDCLNLDY